VTLLGAHTVGHVHNEFTGYGVPGKQTDPLTNAFDETPNKFDNNYYDVNINEVNIIKLKYSLKMLRTLMFIALD
jgi:Peroxidase